MLGRQDLRNRYANSYAGVAWNIGVPLLYAVINTVVFSVLMSGRMGPRYSDVPFSLFYFVPFSLWTLFAEVVGRSPGILREYGYLISKIAFPSWILPLVPLASAMLGSAIAIAACVVLMAVTGTAPAGTAWVYALVWALTAAITVGIAYGVSAVSMYVPDVAQVVPVIVNVLFWLTPILYPPRLVEAGAADWLRAVIMDFNPFFYVVESARLAVFGGLGDAWWNLGLLGVFAASSLAIGLLVFRVLRPGFADVV